jgi:acetyltransferase
MTAGPDTGRGTESLEAFFAPRSVAVIGASTDPSKIGGAVLANLRSANFEGRVVAVNSRAETVQGLRAIPSILAVDEPVDLAVVAVPAAHVLPTLQECVTSGVRAAIVISAGFREIGGEGARREEELRRWLADQPLRVLGPNCLGWIRPAARLNATFAPAMPARGGIAFISHSGALAVAILDWSRDRRMGFSLFASLGNQADVTETDVLTASVADPETRVVVAYLEGLADGRRFFDALRAATALKPVVVLKTGRSAEGARAVASHTGALAGSDLAFDAAVKQAGALRAASIEELFDLARALATQPPPRGRRLLVVTNGGGLGIVATDAAKDAGLLLEPSPADVQRRLRAVLPPTAGVGNPIDLVGDADAARYSHALHAVGDADADTVLVLLTAQAATDSAAVARAIIGATRGWRIPLAAALVGGGRVAPGAAALEEAGIPCYPFPERAVRALAGMALLAERRRPAPVDGVAPPCPGAREAAVAALRGAGTGSLGLADLAPVLAAYGIPVVAGSLATTPVDAGAAAAALGFPVALKIVSPDIAHKSDVGGVALGLTSVEAAVAAATAMLARVAAARPGAAVRGILVQRMAEPGRELLLGAVRDPQFGPVVMVGVGGVYVEVLRDTSARLAPLRPEEARAMLGELRMAPLLHGVRGEPAIAIDAVVDAMVTFGQLVVDLPRLAEIELNPLLAGPKGVVAVDARATLTAPAGRTSRGGTAATATGA